MAGYWVPGVKNKADALSTYGFFVALLGVLLNLASPVIGLFLFILGGTMQFWGGQVYMRYHKGKGNPYEMEDANLKRLGMIFTVIGALEVIVLGGGVIIMYVYF